jgi:hypothetical protein
MRKLWAATVVAAAALAGCASGPDGPTGTATGHLEMVGGPATLSGGTPVSLVPGTITAVSGSATFHASAAKDGSFTFVLPDGTYRLTGTSPQYNSGQGACAAMSPVVVRDGNMTHADVICERS